MDGIILKVSDDSQKKIIGELALKLRDYKKSSNKNEHSGMTWHCPNFSAWNIFVNHKHRHQQSKKRSV